MGDACLKPHLQSRCQEFDLRRPTQNPAAAAAAALALVIAEAQNGDHDQKATQIREVIFSQLDEVNGDRRISAGGPDTVPGILSMIVPGPNSE